MYNLRVYLCNSNTYKDARTQKSNLFYRFVKVLKCENKLRKNKLFNIKFGLKHDFANENLYTFNLIQHYPYFP